MKTFLISDNEDTLVGMRIAGVKGLLANNKEEVLRALNEALADKNIGILIITEKLGELIESEVHKIKLLKNAPLLVEIPDRFGSIKDKESIVRYVKESMGVKI